MLLELLMMKVALMKAIKREIMTRQEKAESVAEHLTGFQEEARGHVTKGHWRSLKKRIIAAEI